MPIESLSQRRDTNRDLVVSEIFSLEHVANPSNSAVHHVTTLVCIRSRRSGRCERLRSRSPEDVTNGVDCRWIRSTARQETNGDRPQSDCLLQPTLEPKGLVCPNWRRCQASAWQVPHQSPRTFPVRVQSSQQ